MKRRQFLSWLGLGPLAAATKVEATQTPKVVNHIVSVELGHRGTVYDADGIEIDRCRYADLVTGYVERLVPDKQAVHEIREYRKAPLKFVPLKKK